MSLSSKTPFNSGVDDDTMEAPHVAILTMDFPPAVGGVQQYLYEIGRRIGLCCQVTVVVPGARPNDFQPEAFRMIAVPSSMPWHFLRVLAQKKPDVVVVGHVHPRLLVSAIVARRRYLVIAHGNDFESAQHSWHAPLTNRLLAHACPLITNSQANAQRLQALDLPHPVVIRPGTDPDRFQPPIEPASGPPILLSVGRLVSRKGIDLVLQALPQLLTVAPELQYWVAGNGPELTPLEQMAKNLGVAHAVQFMGTVSDHDLGKLYQSATVFVLPTRTEEGSVEGFGIVYLEASASGLPVIAARSGGAVEAVKDGETGLLVPPDDPVALAQAVERLIQDPGLCRQMGQVGRQWVETEMNWDRAAREFMDVLEQPH